MRDTETTQEELAACLTRAGMLMAELSSPADRVRWLLEVRTRTRIADGCGTMDSAALACIVRGAEQWFADHPV